MPEPEPMKLRLQLDKLKAVLSVVDSNVALGLTPSEDMRDLQQAIDGLRANVWVILKAGHQEQEQAFVNRMRVRRARETCEEVLADLYAGTLTADTPGLTIFHATASELHRTLEEGLQ